MTDTQRRQVRMNENNHSKLNYEQAFIMGIRLNDLEKSIDWNLVREKEKEIKKALDSIRVIISRKIGDVYHKKEELSEKQLSDAYEEWANDPNEWKRDKKEVWND